MFPTTMRLMREENKVEIAPYLYKFITHPYLRQYFRPKNELYVPQVVINDTPIEKARRFAESDTNFSRVYPLIPELTQEERLELAFLAAKKVEGKTDSTNFARNTLEQFQLSAEGKSQILQDLDAKTNGFVSAALRSQFGR
ncbi:MAG TPA: hypothetical protein VLE96_04205 [Chlamydiales bacterium]|nr:hypothetical protein [Chlamydiales bacterium]